MNLKNNKIPFEHPLILGSITPVSKTGIDREVDYYFKIKKAGFSGMVLPSITTSPNCRFHPESIFIKTNKIDMGRNLSLLGHPNNIFSEKFGLKIVKKLKGKKFDNFIFLASIELSPNSEVSCSLIEELNSNESIGGIELNLACPNTTQIEVEDLLDSDLVKQFDKNLIIKTAVKDSNELYSNIESLSSIVNGITLFDSPQTLIPPEIKNNQIESPFFSDSYSYSGIYGKYNYTNVCYGMSKIWLKNSGLELHASGGNLNLKDVVGVRVIGADVVQFASAIFLNGFNHTKELIGNYLDQFQEEDIIELRKKFYRDVFVSDVAEFYEKNWNASQMHIANVDIEHCIGCGNCQIACRAISMVNHKSHVDQNFCNGCGICIHSCNNKALTLIRN